MSSPEPGMVWNGRGWAPAPNIPFDNPDRLRRFAWKQLYQLLQTIERIPVDARGSLEDIALVLEKFTWKKS